MSATALGLGLGLPFGAGGGGVALPAQTFRLGFYSDSHFPATETWLGVPADFQNAFIREASWANMRTAAANAAVASYTRPPYWALAGTPGLTATPVTPLASIAAGSNDSDITYMFQQLLLTPADANGDHWIRPLWEGNGNFYPWNQGSTTQSQNDNIGVFRKFVTLGRAVSPSFKFSWCVNLTNIDVGNGHYDPVLAYPGDTYVDYIEGDVYFDVGLQADGGALFGYYSSSADRGMTWLYNFAATHGKPWGIPEWGINSDTATYWPVIDSMYNFLVANGAGRAGYWDSTSNFNARLSNNQYPLAGARFIADFGAPTITSAASASVETGVAFSFNLVASKTGTWQISGGADASKFSLANINVAAGTADLIMPPKNYLAPTDAGGNNVYDVQLRFVDPRQKFVTQNFAATVLAAYVFTNSEAAAYVARMPSAPLYGRKQLIDAFFGSSKAGVISGSNIYTKTKEMYLFAAHTSQASLLGLKNQGDSSGVNTPTFTTDRGWTGSGSAYVTTAIAPNVATPWTQNSSSMGIWELTNVANNSGSMGGAGNSGINARNVSDQITSDVNTFSGIAVSGITDGRGLTIGNRSGASAAQVYKNGLLVGSNTGASAAPNANPFVFHATNPAFPAPRQIAFGYIGGSLTANEHKDLYNAVRTYLIGVGAILAGDYAVAT